MTNDFRPGDPLRPTAGPRADHGTAVDPVFDAGAVRPPFDPRPNPVAAPVEPPRVRARGGAGMLVNVLLGLALVVAVGGVAFAAGRATAPATASAAARGGNGGFFQGGQGGPNASGTPGGFNGGFGAGGVSIQGTVTAISADSITLQLTGGQTVTIPIDAQTTYHQRETATAAAVTSGSTVVVQLQGGGRGGLGGGSGQNGGPTASGAPGRSLGPASTITVVPAGS